LGHVERQGTQGRTPPPVQDLYHRDSVPEL